MKKLLPVLLLASAVAALGQARDLTRHVNPFIGTGGHGHTFPGATVPFGMVQLSPDTRIDNWDGSSGYHYSDNIIYGFSHTHLSGTGIPDGCDILLMPALGDPQFFAKTGDKSVNGYASKFSHAHEKAEPGYYSVKLDDDGIVAEMTATKRVGLHKYTFPSSEKAKILLDLKWRDKLLDGEIEIKGNRVEGFRSSSSWAKNQTVYFVAEFSERIKVPKFGPELIGIQNGKVILSKLKPAQVILSFDLPMAKSLLVKVAISYVSIDGARKNLEQELPGWDFDKVRADAKAAWNKELCKIEVSGGTTDQTTNFYTALYHTMIHPNVFNDVDGRYMGHDRKIYQLPRIKGPDPNASPNHYTVFSLWDTFRAAHPLYTIIDQKRTVDYINSFIRIYEQGGRLPVWELWGEETDTMIGYHAVSVIADAMAKGIRGFDYEKAYRAAKHSAELDHHGLAAYKKRGFISSEDDTESVSKTLEYAYNDWCIVQMLFAIKRDPAYGYSTDEEAWLKKYGPDLIRYSARSRNFENLFDWKTGFMRPKKNGGFLTPFAPNNVTFHYTEANAWQYTFFVPHDPHRLAELLGGHAKLGAKLDELFSTTQKLEGRDQPDITGLIGQYAHGNEPSHHVAYMYNYAREPWKTQRTVRRILDGFYKPTPDGLIGNEDCGQMSAWYVLSASGFYPVAPGFGSYAIGSPLFEQVKFHLENGKTFTINAKGVSPNNIYIRSARYGGKNLPSPHIAHAWIMEGTTVDLEMSPTPVETAFDRFIAPGTGSRRAPVPVIEVSELVTDVRTVSITTIPSKGSQQPRIYYTTDGSVPNDGSHLYMGPFQIPAASTVKAVSIPPGPAGNYYRSFVAEASFRPRGNDWTVKVTSGYSQQYAGADDAIVDGLRGTTNFAAGDWQGIQGKMYEAVVDLKRLTRLTEVGASFLQNVGVWIWLPSVIEFEASRDGVTFENVANIRTGFPQREMRPTIKEYSRKVMPVNARYVRIRAHNFGKIPAWHPGAGGDPWIFIDEVIIR